MVTPSGTVADAGSLARIDHDGVVGKDVVVMIPLVESSPVVATNQQGELDVGVILAHGLQRVPGIGWLRQAELIVACLQLWLVLQRLFYHFQAQLVVEQVGSGLLERGSWAKP